MCTDHVNSTPTLSTIFYSMPLLFLPIFPDFLLIFVLITILGNAHRPSKQYVNIVINSLHCHLEIENVECFGIQTVYLYLSIFIVTLK